MGTNLEVSYMSVKKKICLIIVVVLLIGALVGIILKNTVFNPWVSNKDYLYDAAVNAIIAEEKEKSPDRNVSGFHTFASFHKFGVQKGANSSEKIVYIWINYQSYYVEGDQIWKSTGGSYPYKVTFVNDEFVKYEIPNSGGNYQNEIRNLFPDKIEVTSNDIIREIPLDGSCESSEFENMIFIFSQKGLDLIIPLRAVEEDFKADLQAMIVAGTSPRHTKRKE